MPEIIPDHVPSPRTLLAWDGTAYRPVHISATGDIQVDVLTSGLPAGAAIAANQVTMITALQLIDDLRGALRNVNTDAILIAARDNVGAVRDLLADAARHLQVDVLTNANLDDALQSVATDRLIVRGEDQLISFGGVLASLRSGVVSGAGGWIASNAVPAGTIWHVTHICAWDVTSPTTKHTYFFRHDGVNHRLHIETTAFAASQGSYFSCDFWMDPVDEIRVTYAGSLAGDTCGIDLIGHIMTLEV